MKTKHADGGNPAGVVLAFINALNDEDFKSARKYTSDALRFVGVMGSRDGAEAYFADMKKMKLKYDIKKIFGDDKDVSVWYTITMNNQDILSSGLYHVEGGLIDHFQVLFDPTPLTTSNQPKTHTPMVTEAGG